MIPKKMHQVWLGEAPIPEKFLVWQNEWQKLHPDWEYKLWTEKDLAPIKKYLEGFNKFSSKANVARLWIVLNNGGVYSDMDFEWNKNIDELLKFQAFAAKHGDVYCNAIFGAVAQNPWVRYQLDSTKKYINVDPPWGPKLMTKACDKFPNSFQDVPQKFFYPYLWDEKPKPANFFPESFAVHHWEKSWKGSA